MSRLAGWFDHWLFEEFRISAEGLGMFRVFYCLFVLFLFGLPDFSWIGDSPDYYFNPRLFSLAALFPGFPPAAFFTALTVLVMLGFGFLLAGWHTRKVSVLISLLIISGKSFAYSFGKIDHDIVLWIIPLFMAFSGWGEAFSVDRKVHEVKYGGPKETHAWPIAMLAFLLGFGMFTAALPKLLGGWLSYATQATQAHHAFNYYVVGRTALLAQPALQLQSRFIWEFHDWFTILFEGAFVIAIWKLSRLRVLLLITLVFHFMVMLMLNIPFLANLPIYALFLPWNIVAKGVARRHIIWEPLRSVGISLVTVAISALLTLRWTVAGRSLWLNLAVLGAALLIAAYFAFGRRKFNASHA